MAASDWRLEGEWIKNCTCAFGCPCDFNALPTQGYCKGMVGMRITKGHFEKTKLDGLVFAKTVDFPGALHEGNGQSQPIIDERATAEQREALLNIMSGKFSAEGTLFHIFSLIVTKIHDPLFVPITFSFDKDGRVARMVAKGVLETEVEPIKNPVTGEPHRIQVVRDSSTGRPRLPRPTSARPAPSSSTPRAPIVRSPMSSRRRRASRPSAAS